MARLTIQLLGSFGIWRGEKASGINFRTEKERALFAYLAAEKERSFSREALAELLWPERPPGSGRTNLRQALSGLRRALKESHAEPEFLLADDETIGFNRASQAWFDVEAFEAHLQSSNEHDHPALESCASCMQRLERAVDLYRGDFLQDLLLSDSPAFQEWALFRREQYFAQFLSALQSLGTYYLDTGDYERAYRVALRQVNLAPLEESGYRRLMMALSVRNRRGAALEQYYALERLLHAELRVRPAPETQQLYELIRSGAPLLVGPKPPSGPLRTCALPLTTFVDRKAELAWVERCLENPVCRLIALVGLPGVGKSRLALEAARRFGARFDDGVYCLTLDAQPANVSLPLALASALDLKADDETIARSLLFERLRGRKMLIVLDQMEPLLDQAAFLVELVQRAPDVKIILPTYRRLHLQAACSMQIEGLPYPRGAASPPNGASPAVDTPFADYPAVQLFLARAERTRPAVADSNEALADIVELCRQVEGHPLALELAAQALRSWSPAEIGRRSEQSLAVFQTRLQDIPERQRSLQACFTPAWDSLALEQRALMYDLALFPDDFSRELIRQQFAGDEALAQLANHAFVLPANEATQHYRLHPLLRRFTLDRLYEQPAALEQARRRFSAGLLQACAAQVGGLCRSRESCCGDKGCAAEPLPGILEWFENEGHNLQQALNWAVEASAEQQIEAALQAVQQAFRGIGACTCCETCLDSLHAALLDLKLSPQARVVAETYCPGGGWCCDRVGAIADALDAMLLVTKDGQIVEANYAANQLTGYTRQALENRSVKALILAEAETPPSTANSRGFIPLNLVTRQAVLAHASGALLPVNIERRPWPTDDSAQYLVTLRPAGDNGEASGGPGYDPLTQLPNRALFLDRLRHALALTDRANSEISVILLDLANLAEVNAQHSAAAGDELLQAVGRRLTDCLRRSDTLARMGGDEFAVLLETAKGIDGVQVVLGKLERQFAAPFTLGGREVVVQPQMGVCCYPSCAADAESIMRQADQALKKAQAGGAVSVIYCQASDILPA